MKIEYEEINVLNEDLKKRINALDEKFIKQKMSLIKQEKDLNRYRTSFDNINKSLGFRNSTTELNNVFIPHLEEKILGLSTNLNKNKNNMSNLFESNSTICLDNHLNLDKKRYSKDNNDNNDNNEIFMNSHSIISGGENNEFLTNENKEKYYNNKNLNNIMIENNVYVDNEINLIGNYEKNNYFNSNSLKREKIQSNQNIDLKYKLKENYVSEGIKENKQKENFNKINYLMKYHSGISDYSSANNANDEMDQYNTAVSVNSNNIKKKGNRKPNLVIDYTKNVISLFLCSKII